MNENEILAYLKDEKTHTAVEISVHTHIPCMTVIRTLRELARTGLVKIASSDQSLTLWRAQSSSETRGRVFLPRTRFASRCPKYANGKDGPLPVMTRRLSKRGMRVMQWK